MTKREELDSPKLSRRESLKLSGLALGGLALGRRLDGQYPLLVGGDCPTGTCYPTAYDTQRYSYFESLETMDYRQLPVLPGMPRNPNTPTGTPALEPNEMRVTFMGSCIPPVRRAQAMMSIFVEVGWENGKALDQAIFDCGSGCCANYGAMGVGFGRMDKIFLTHLHGDHISDLTHIYCFGPSLDRISPLYVWGPGDSWLKNPQPGDPPYFKDGIRDFCGHFREAMRWHTESFSFQNTSYPSYQRPTKKSWGLPVDPVPVSDDPPDDAYAIVPIDLDWSKVGGVAYWNRKTGLKISHYPVIHCRQGSLAYKVEWEGLSMIYTSDTKPELNTIFMAQNYGLGIDLLVHEMIVPPEIWAMESLHYARPAAGPAWDNAVARLTQVQNSSHTSQGAFGYLLSQINPRPRLTVATHFPVSDDTVACALESVNRHCPEVPADIALLAESPLIWSFDLMVLRLFAGNPKPEILRRRALVLEHGFSPIAQMPVPASQLYPPKYHDRRGNGDPYAQIDTAAQIEPGPDTYCENGY